MRTTGTPASTSGLKSLARKREEHADHAVDPALPGPVEEVPLALGGAVGVDRDARRS